MSDRLNDGLLLGYQAGQDDQAQVTAIWKRQAKTMRGQLEQQINDTAEQWLQCKAWLEVAKLMLEEIRESNPNSPLADKEHVNGLYRELCHEMRGQLEAGIEPEAVTIKPR
ncbi:MULTISPECIES: hypothetical protein [Aeromonas]|uniref:hypothetical protein n=1 Tax=Aeromonas TaxID=642 RepID=UPI0021671DBD|nr:hypothetical protein [Aeromonas hydrophila]MCS3794638.1 hypothetical protein [Aeromonas hydrophila]